MHKPMTRRTFLKHSVVATAGLSLSPHVLQHAWGSQTKKVLVLGFDGMDPQLLQRFVKAGKLPHFQSLMQTGTFQPLATSIPPLSPVAWANFITGNPSCYL